MRLLLFRFFSDIVFYFFPCKDRVRMMKENRQNHIHLYKRDSLMNSCSRPRTETHEWYTPDKADRRHYTDYDEAQAYHDGKK